MLKSRIALAASERLRRLRSACLEPLENRRLMSATLPAVALAAPARASDPAPAKPVETMQWRGKSIEARSGEWILGLDQDSDLVKGWRAPAQVQTLQHRLGAGGSPAVVEKQLGRDGQFLLQVPGA